MRAKCFEHVASRLGALGSKVASLPGRSIDYRALFLRDCERGQPREWRGTDVLEPFSFFQIKPRRCERPVDRASRTLAQRRAPCLVIIGDLRQAFACRLLHERLQSDGRARQVIEQRFQALMEERQPMF